MGEPHRPFDDAPGAVAPLIKAVDTRTRDSTAAPSTKALPSNLPAPYVSPFALSKTATPGLAARLPDGGSQICRTPLRPRQGDRAGAQAPLGPMGDPLRLYSEWQRASGQAGGCGRKEARSTASGARRLLYGGGLCDCGRGLSHAAAQPFPSQYTVIRSADRAEDRWWQRDRPRLT
jgi:hypothetical protein